MVDIIDGSELRSASTCGVHLRGFRSRSWSPGRSRSNPYGGLRGVLGDRDQFEVDPSW